MHSTMPMKQLRNARETLILRLKCCAFSWIQEGMLQHTADTPYSAYLQAIYRWMSRLQLKQKAALTLALMNLATRKQTESGQSTAFTLKAQFYRMGKVLMNEITCSLQHMQVRYSRWRAILSSWMSYELSDLSAKRILRTGISSNKQLHRLCRAVSCPLKFLDSIPFANSIYMAATRS